MCMVQNMQQKVKLEIPRLAALNYADEVRVS